MNKDFFKVTIGLTILRLILFFSLLLWLTISMYKAINENGQMIIAKKITISICFLALYLVIILINISLLINFKNDYLLNYKIIIFLAILSLNIEILAIAIKNKPFVEKNIENKKLTTYDLVVVSILLAMYFIFSFITTFIPTTQFFFIELSFKYLPLFFGAFILKKRATFILCFLAATLTFFLPGVYIAFWQFFFDYWLTAFSIFFASYFVPLRKVYSFFSKLSIWLTFVSVPILIIYFSRVTSGVIFWLNPDKQTPHFEFEWSNILGYSLIYNAINTIFDYIMLLILVPLIFETLWFIKEKNY